ncbi:hypothetical protein B484DRAFT_424173, partial [Ochromonadaceae sp. CCMP2298]
MKANRRRCPGCDVLTRFPSRAHFSRSLSNSSVTAGALLATCPAGQTPDSDRETREASQIAQMEESDGDLDYAGLAEGEDGYEFDSDLPMGVLKQRLANYDGLLRENGLLLGELKSSKGKVQKMERVLMAEISNAKRVQRFMEDTIDDLEKELEGKKSLMQQSSLTSESSIAGLTALRLEKEAAEGLVNDLRAQMTLQRGSIEYLERQVRDLGDQLATTVGKKDSAELRMHRMEADLRERDKLEAARDSSNQSKAYSEERVKQMEAKLLSLHRSKESLKAALARRDAEYRQLFNEKVQAREEVDAVQVEMSMMRVTVEDGGLLITSLEERVIQLVEEARQAGLAYMQVVERNEKSIEELGAERERSEGLAVALEKKASELKKVLLMLNTPSSGVNYELPRRRGEGGTQPLRPATQEDVMAAIAASMAAENGTSTPPVGGASTYNYNSLFAAFSSPGAPVAAGSVGVGGAGGAGSVV